MTRKKKFYQRENIPTRRYDQKITTDRIVIDPRIGYTLSVQVQDPVAVYDHEDNLHPNNVLQPGDEEYVFTERHWLGSMGTKTRLLVTEYKEA